MLTQLFRITPPGDNQQNISLNSLAVVAYEQIFDGNVWNARRGAQDIVLLNQQSPAPGTYNSATQTNYNSTRLLLIYRHSYAANITLSIKGVSPADGTNFVLMGTDTGGLSNTIFVLPSTGPISSVLYYVNVPKNFFVQAIIPAGAGSISLSLSMSGY